jgi:hypothetical protein
VGAVRATGGRCVLAAKWRTCCSVWRLLARFVGVNAARWRRRWPAGTPARKPALTAPLPRPRLQLAALQQLGVAAAALTSLTPKEEVNQIYQQMAPGGAGAPPNLSDAAGRALLRPQTPEPPFPRRLAPQRARAPVRGCSRTRPWWAADRRAPSLCSPPPPRLPRRRQPAPDVLHAGKGARAVAPGFSAILSLVTRGDARAQSHTATAAVVLLRRQAGAAACAARPPITTAAPNLGGSLRHQCPTGRGPDKAMQAHCVGRCFTPF